MDLQIIGYPSQYPIECKQYSDISTWKQLINDDMVCILSKWILFVNRRSYICLYVCMYVMLPIGFIL